MGRVPPLSRARRPEQITRRQRHPDRTGGHPRGTDRLNHHIEESHDDVVHHVHGLDLAYGSSWRKFHWTKIEEFAKVKGNSLRLFLPDPDDDASMEVLAKRYAYTSQKVRDNVLETAEEFARLGVSDACQADIRIYYRAGDPTYTSYSFDDKVLVTLYANRRRRGDVPTMLFGQGSFRDFFKEDLDAIADQSRPVPLSNVTGEGGQR